MTLPSRRTRARTKWSFWKYIFRIGTIIKKKFESHRGWYEGEITNYNPKVKFYKIKYKGGDIEELEHVEASCSIKPKQAHIKSVIRIIPCLIHRGVSTINRIEWKGRVKYQLKLAPPWALRISYSQLQAKLDRHRKYLKGGYALAASLVFRKAMVAGAIFDSSILFQTNPLRTVFLMQ